MNATVTTMRAGKATPEEMLEWAHRDSESQGLAIDMLTAISQELNLLWIAIVDSNGAELYALPDHVFRAANRIDVVVGMLSSEREKAKVRT